MNDPAAKADIKAVVADDGLRSIFDLINDQQLTLEIGNLQIDNQGRLSLHARRQPIAFSFRYRNATFDTKVCIDQDTRIALRATLGAVPFSAESRPARRRCLGVLTQGQNTGHGGLRLSKLHDVVYSAAAVPPSPVTPGSVIATVTALLLEVRPHMDALSEAKSHREPGPAT